MAKLIGKIETFDEKSSNWETYHERLELIFTVNSIKEDAQKVPLMLSYLGPCCLHYTKKPISTRQASRTDL